MREELHVMELVDRYLDGKLDAAERAAFETRMQGNEGLRELTEDQRALREGMTRLKLRAAVGKAYKSYHFGKWWPGIAGAVVVGGIIAGGVLFMRSEQYHELYHTYIHDPYIFQQENRAGEDAGPAAPADHSDTVAAEAHVTYDTVVRVITKHYWYDPATGDTIEVRDVRADEEARVLQHPASRDIDPQVTYLKVNEQPAEVVHTDSPEIDPKPVFPGGEAALRRYLGSNLVYPKSAEEKNVQGRVVTSFVVMQDGSVRFPRIEQGIGEGCDEEALRVITAMPKWKPGKLNGEVANVRIEMPIVFMLSAQQVR